METRELFEQLLADEPPLSLGAAAASARGLQAARRRQGGFAAGGVAALVLAVIVAGAQLAGPDQRQRGTLVPNGPSPITSLPFTSVSQVTDSNARVYALLAAQIRGLVRVPSGSAGVWTSPPDGSMPSVAGARVLYRLPAAPTAIADLTVMTATAADAQSLEQWLSAGSPCSAKPVQVQGETSAATDCAKADLGGGAVLWSSLREVTDHGATRIVGRSATIVAGDGSTLDVELGLDQEVDLGRDPLVAIGPGLPQIRQLAEQAAAVWLTPPSSVAPFPSAPAASASVGDRVTVQPSLAPTSQAASAVPSPAAPSRSGPASLPFLSAHQIAASNARVYGILVAYAGGAAVVTRGAPLWDTNPVTDATQFVGTQVQYRASSGTGMLRVVTDTAADAKSRYGGLLSGDLCAELAARSTDDGTFVGCRRQALAGGGTLWTYSRKESTPGEISNRDPSSTLGPAVYEDDAIVVAKDGSTLDLLFQVLAEGGAAAPLPLTDGTKPDLASLGGLALDAAATWQPHDADLAPAASGS